MLRIRAGCGNHGLQARLLGGQRVEVGIGLGVSGVHLFQLGLGGKHFAHGLFHTLAHRVLRVELGFLGQVADLDPRHGDGFAFDFLVHTRHDLEQGGFARAVQAQHADLGAGEEAQGDVFQDLPLGRHGLGDAVHRINVLGHWDLRGSNLGNGAEEFLRSDADYRAMRQYASRRAPVARCISTLLGTKEAPCFRAPNPEPHRLETGSATPGCTTGRYPAPRTGASKDMTFDELNLAPAILKAVHETGYETPTPIQAQAIPAVLEGHDLLAGAQTGTGKTAAFTLPMLHRLSQGTAPKNKFGGKGIRALVLTPTRELAAQVEESVREYGKYLDINSTVVFGGVGMNPQIDRIKRGVDILVATPGRLLDLQQQGFLDLTTVEVLVLDEADRMLDMGFIHDVKKVLALVPKDKQSLLFSATFSDEIRDLANTLLKNPQSIQVTPATPRCSASPR